MDHAEAHEVLADLALEPGRLAALDTRSSAATAALRGHIAACTVCASDVDAWRRSWTAFGAARSGANARSGAADQEPARAPASLRAHVLHAIAADTRALSAAAGPAASTRAFPSDRSAVADAPRPALLPLPTAARRWTGRHALPWLAAAAALVIAIGAGTLAWVRTGEANQARADASNLAQLATTLNRVLADPVHWTTPLAAADGTPAGTLAWSRTQLVVVSGALPAPGPGQVYRCWVEYAATRTPVGAMEFTEGMGYWVGSMTGWGDLLTPGAKFGVSLVPASGGEGAPVLVGAL